MPLLKAYEDFANRTLGAFTSALEKLKFVSSLKVGDGTYAHYGMERTYGGEQANRAIARAHSELTIEILETPLPELLREADSVSLGLDGEALGPHDWKGGAKEHLDYVVTALSLLNRTSASASRPVA